MILNLVTCFFIWELFVNTERTIGPESAGWESLLCTQDYSIFIFCFQDHLKEFVQRFMEQFQFLFDVSFSKINEKSSLDVCKSEGVKNKNVIMKQASLQTVGKIKSLKLKKS